MSPHLHRHGPGVPARIETGDAAAISRVLLVTGALNVVVLLAKLWVGMATGALAVFADALHSAGDLANNVLGVLIVRLAHRPPDQNHPYGHRKFESLAVFVLGVVLVGLAFELVSTAIRGDTEPPVSSVPAISTMVGVLLVNIGVTWYEHRAARRLGSSLLRADAKHTLSDVLVTISAIGGWQLAALGVHWADRAAAGLVAAAVCFIAYDLFRSAVPILVDAAALEADHVRSSATSVEGVRSVSAVRSRWIGNQAAVELTIRVAPDLPTEEAHRIADAVEAAITRDLSADDITIHVEPEPPA